MLRDGGCTEWLGRWFKRVCTTVPLFVFVQQRDKLFFEKVLQGVTTPNSSTLVKSLAGPGYAHVLLTSFLRIIVAP